MLYRVQNGRKWHGMVYTEKVGATIRSVTSKKGNPRESSERHGVCRCE